MTQFEKLDLLLRECGGTIQTFEVLNNGISKSVLYAYVKKRGLEQASHGLYVTRYVDRESLKYTIPATPFAFNKSPSESNCFIRFLIIVSLALSYI